MNNRLASTTFSTGVKDAVAVLDKYAVTSGSKINSIQEISHEAMGVIDKLVGGLTSGMPDMLKNVAGDIKLDPEALATRLVGNNPGLKAAFNGLTTVTKSNILDKVKGSADLTASINNIVSVVSGAKFDRLTGLTNIASRLVGGSVIDIGDTMSNVSMISGLVKESNILGIKGALGTFVGAFDNLQNRAELITNLIKTSIPDLVKFADIDSINQLMDGAVGKTIKDIYPLFSKDIANAFGLATNKDGTLNIADSYPALLGVLNTTNPGWNRFNRVQDGNIDVGFSLAEILTGSKDHILTFQQGGIRNGTGDHRFHAMVGFIKARTVQADVQRQFGSLLPKASAILKTNSSGSIKKNSVIDANTVRNIKAVSLLGTLLMADD